MKLRQNEEVWRSIYTSARLTPEGQLYGDEIVDALRRNDREAEIAALGGIAIKLDNVWNFEQAKKADVVFIPGSGSPLARRRRSWVTGEVDEIHDDETGPMALRSIESVRLGGQTGGLVLRSLLEGPPPYFYDQAFVNWWNFRQDGHQLAVLTPQELRF